MDDEEAEAGWYSESPSDASDSSSDDGASELGDEAAAAAERAAEGTQPSADGAGASGFKTLMLQRRGVQRLVKMVRAKRESWRPSWHAHYLRIHA